MRGATVIRDLKKVFAILFDANKKIDLTAILCRLHVDFIILFTGLVGIPFTWFILRNLLNEFAYRIN